jgi:hypothetical protein
MGSEQFSLKKHFRRGLWLRAACLAALAGTAAGVRAADEDDHGFRHDILIADQYNNRVIIVDPKTYEVEWAFGNGSDRPGPHSIVGVNDAIRYGRLTLMSGTGIPPSDPPLPGCANPTNGCPDNRVLLVDRHGHIVWQYGQGGVSGAGFNQLNTPVQASIVKGFQHRHGLMVMITDQANQRIIVVDRKGHLLWQYGTTGVTGDGFDQLNNPNSAVLLDNGHVLIADESNNRVIEVTTDLAIVKTLTAGGTLNGVAFASRLPDGDTLISDSNNNRIVEVDAMDKIVWQYATNTMPGSNPNPLPTRAVRLANGNTLISDQFNDRVIEVNHDKKIVFQYGKLNMPGLAFDKLNGPYDAKVLGDFTGLGAPFDKRGDHDDDNDDQDHDD